MRVCVDQARGRVPVIAGCGSNDTAVALHHIHAAKAAGATAALLVPPYYNRPNQEGVFRHFEVLAQGGGLPIVLYNVPGRTITDINVETVERIVQAFPDVVVGIKDATGQMARVAEHRLRCGAGFAQLSGNDDMALAFNAMGGVGAISVTANVAPAMCAEFQDACTAGDYGRALTIQDRLFPLHAALFSDASPGPVKYALGRVRPGFPTDLRLPMTPASAASQAAVDAALAHAGLVR